MKTSIRYLGVYLDTGLRIMTHVRRIKARRKIQRSCSKLNDSEKRLGLGSRMYVNAVQWYIYSNVCSGVIVR